MEQPARITRDELDAWREHPVTAWVIAALESHAAAQRDEWASLSWEGGTADQLALTELRTRADAYRAVADAQYDDFCKALGEVPSEE